MRNTPVIIFVNKMDREAKDPFDLLDELEEELIINVRILEHSAVFIVKNIYCSVVRNADICKSALISFICC